MKRLGDKNVKSCQLENIDVSENIGALTVRINQSEKSTC